MTAWYSKNTGHFHVQVGFDIACKTVRPGETVLSHILCLKFYYNCFLMVADFCYIVPFVRNRKIFSGSVLAK